MINTLPANAEDPRDSGSIPRLGRSPGGGNDNPLQYSCLENSMDKGACQTIVHGVVKSQTWLSANTLLFSVFFFFYIQSSHFFFKSSEGLITEKCLMMNKEFLALSFNTI